MNNVHFITIKMKLTLIFKMLSLIASEAFDEF